MSIHEGHRECDPSLMLDGICADCRVPHDCQPARCGGVSSPEEALAAALDWSWEPEPGVPSPTEIMEDVLAHLRDLGYEVVEVGHPGCAAAVQHVVDTHHGMDYPKCAAAWASLSAPARVLDSERPSMP